MKNSLYKLVFFVVQTIFLSSVFIFPLSSVAQPISQLEKECNSNKFSSCGALGSKYILGEVVRLSHSVFGKSSLHFFTTNST